MPSSYLVNSIVLIVVDVQKGFDDPVWGQRNNPACEENVAALIDAWRSGGQPVVFVRHDSVESGSSLRPDQPGNQFKDVITGAPDMFVSKNVNSSFHGEPDLEAWLRARGTTRIAVCGIQTNMCCETTARVGANLGFELSFVLDATYTFDQPAREGGMISADALAHVTASNLDPEFGRVVSTRDVIAELGDALASHS